MPLDVLGALFLTLAPLLFVFGVVEAGSDQHPAVWITALVASLAAGVMFITTERRARHPLVPIAFFRNRARLLANGATALLSAALSTSFLLFTFYLQEQLGLTPLITGLSLLPLAVSLVLAVTFVPRLLDRLGARFCILAGLTLTGSAMIAITAVAYFHVSAIGLIPAMVLIAAGMGFGLVGLQYVAVTGVTEDDAGIASGVQRAADQLGGSAGVALYVGIGFAPVFVDNTPYLISSALALVGLVGASALVTRIATSRTQP